MKETILFVQVVCKMKVHMYTQRITFKKDIHPMEQGGEKAE